MPRCHGCSTLIMSGRYCKQCQYPDQLESYDPDTPDSKECHNCDGKSYVETPDGKDDCEVCDGVGIITPMPDGGLSTDTILAAIDRYHLKALRAASIDERDYWQRHRDQMQLALIERGRELRGEVMVR